jgi:hypothetical protein
LNLSSEKLVSIFAFKFNLDRYTVEADAPRGVGQRRAPGRLSGARRGLRRVQLPGWLRRQIGGAPVQVESSCPIALESAWFLNPCTRNVISWFQSLLSMSQLVPLRIGEEARGGAHAGVHQHLHARPLPLPQRQGCTAGCQIGDIVHTGCSSIEPCYMDHPSCHQLNRVTTWTILGVIS